MKGQIESSNETYKRASPSPSPSLEQIKQIDIDNLPMESKKQKLRAKPTYKSRSYAHIAHRKD